MERIKCKGSNCKNNCCLAFNGISDRIKPFGKDVAFSDIILSKDDYDRLLKNGHHELVEEGTNGFYKLKTSPEGVCSAFIDGKCKIYSCRPTVCRAYPFYIDMFAGLCTIRDCCACPDDDEINKYRDDIAAVISVYKMWIALYEEKLAK